MLCITLSAGESRSNHRKGERPMSTKEDQRPAQPTTEPAQAGKKTFILDINEIGLELSSDELKMAVGGCNNAQDPSGVQATYTNYGCYSDPSCDPLVC